ncbi:zinc finger protein 281 isoform X2 [Ambystoma mexicanum]|uniref:zinc finger protein 281 isoform X2 n=1 Tax=Ambystoma mexicanum TaxID=8296 RepID=UPI0037E8FA20
MEPAFPPSMLMFSHLPPVTSFGRLPGGSALLCEEMSLKKEPSSPPRRSPLGGYLHIKQEGEVAGGLQQLRQQLAREQEQQARQLAHEHREQLAQHREQQDQRAREQRAQDQQEQRAREQLSLQEQHYRLFSGGGPQEDAEDGGIMQVTVGNHNIAQDLSLEKELSLLGEVESASLSPSQKPHICEHCNAAFRSSYHLRRHVLIHTGERPFQCSQCSMSFIQKYLLQRHEKIHSGEKPFCCDQCDMKFIQKYHMERHKRTHSGEKPYKCDTCQQYFSRTDRLLKHKRTCGDTTGKGGAVMEPGSSNNMDNLSGNFELSQGNASSSGRRKGKSKSLSTQNKEHKSGNKLNEPQMPMNSSLQNYAVEIPVVSSSSDLMGMAVEETHARVPKLVFKKVNRKNAEKNEHTSMTAMPDMSRQKHSSKTTNSLELTSSGEETISLLQSTKQGQNSSNYDDAMQFLKKRRYLQAANCNSAYSVNLGHMVSQQSVIQSAVGSVMDSETPLALIDSSSLNTEIKACQDKSGIPDEVLQSLLDHYTHKSDGQHEVPFTMNEHVDLAPSGDHSQLVQEENVCSDSQSTQNDKANMLYEYSKYLQQALERTSHSTSFPLGHSLQFVSLSSTLSNHSLFSDKQIYTTSPIECGFSPSIASVLPATLPKSHFGMLVGTQPSFSLSTLESAHQQLTPSQELADQIDPQKSLETSSNYQIASQELNNQKEQQKHLESSSNFHLNSPELDNQIDHQKNIGPRETFQIENFAQAFGSQFKSGNRVPLAFNTNSNSEVDHRIRTSVAEFSGYTNILSDVGESGNSRVKTSTSQSYR